jgi:hypothetical protein
MRQPVWSRVPPYKLEIPTILMVEIDPPLGGVKIL